jgi:hypothetical protein
MCRRLRGRWGYVCNAGSPEEIEAAFADFAAQRVGAVTFAADAVFNAHRDQLVTLAARNKLPTMYFYRAFANAGGLISYGGYDTDAYRLAGVYAGRIDRQGAGYRGSAIVAGSRRRRHRVGRAFSDAGRRARAAARGSRPARRAPPFPWPSP